MSSRQLLFTLMTVAALACGQILFKLAARNMTDGSPLLQQLTQNAHLWWALLVYAIATGMWVALLRQIPLHIAYPFIALAFLFVPVLGYWFLDEPLRWQNLMGACIIAVGVWISVGME